MVCAGSVVHNNQCNGSTPTAASVWRASTNVQVTGCRRRFCVPGVSVSVTGKDVSLDDLIEALGDAQKEARKAREQKLDVKTWQRVMRDKSRPEAS